jgi:phosphate transport system substrate-binding protein
MIAKSRAARFAATILLGIVVLGGVGGPAQADTPVLLKGAGATFPAPLYYKWMEAYGREKPGVRISYDSVGSGDDISRFVGGAVDFGASDAGLSEKDAEKVARGTLLIPATAGMIALAYNLPGLQGALKLPRDVYVDILLGKITNWGDPRIRQANPGLAVQSRTIALVGRLDKSGTTYALTNHLSAVSENWKARFGVGTWIEWPRNAMLARGNEGVASRIKISEGAIGYVEYGFAKRLGLSMAELQNKSGQFVAPNENTAKSALVESVAASGIKLFITDPVESNSYPVVTFSWLLLYRQYPGEQKRVALRDFVDWGLTKGQALGPALGFIPLPEGVVERSRLTLSTVR